MLSRFLSLIYDIRKSLKAVNLIDACQSAVLRLDNILILDNVFEFCLVRDGREVPLRLWP